MKILTSIFAVSLMGAFMLGNFQTSSTSAVSLIGGVLKARHSQKEEKYPREECPVCEGKGWYISGDGIEKVDCGYCEPPSKNEPDEPQEELNQQDPPLVPIKPDTFILRK